MGLASASTVFGILLLGWGNCACVDGCFCFFLYEVGGLQNVSLSFGFVDGVPCGSRVLRRNTHAGPPAAGLDDSVEERLAQCVEACDAYIPSALALHSTGEISKSAIERFVASVDWCTVCCTCCCLFVAGFCSAVYTPECCKI